MRLFALLFVFYFFESSEAYASCANPGGNSYASQLKCLSCNCYHEAKGELPQSGSPIDGGVAVTKVVINRVFDTRFPSTACQVVFEKGQYQWTRQDKRYQSVPAGHRCNNIAKDAINGVFRTLPANFDYVFFVNKSYYNNLRGSNRSWWQKKCQRSKTIKNHLFCGKADRRTAPLAAQPVRSGQSRSGNNQ